jgi:hypothetical protein
MSVFTHAGVSRLNGEFKVRFANDAPVSYTHLTLPTSP